MGLEHFVNGAADGGHKIELLGHSGLVLPETKEFAGQRPALYSAETKFRGSDPEARKTISPNGARDLIEDIIHHPGLDDIPGIEHLRNTFNANAHTSFHRTIRRVDENGNVVGVPLGLVRPDNQNMMFANSPDNPLRQAIVTHETAHKVLMNAAQLGHIPVHGGHSWPMARTHVQIVRKMFGGAAAYALKEHYRTMGVDFGKTSNI